MTPLELVELRSLIRSREIHALVIGASAGAVDALSSILPALSADTPLMVVVVVHIPPDRECILAELYHQKCAVTVLEAEDKVPLMPGTVYFAPPNYHLLVESDYVLSLSSDEPVLYSRPSIDVLFESAADVFRNRLIGIILTGANNDGARGLAKIAVTGGITIVQSPDEAEASFMPRSALELCPHAFVMSLQEISALLRG